MGAQASSSFDSSSEDSESDGSSCNSSRVSRRSSHTSEDKKDDEDDEDINNLTNFQRKIVSQSSENRVACMSTVKSGISAPYESPSLCKPQNQPLLLSHQQKQQSLLRSLRESSLLNTRMVDSSSVDVEAEKNKKLLEWELSALEADDLRSHAWYHGQQVDRIEAERLLRQYVTEEHGFGIIVERQHTEEDTSDSDGANDITSDNSDSDETIDIASDSSDAGFPFEDLVDEHGVVVDPLKATSTRLAAAVKLRQRRCLDGVLPTKRPKRPRRHFYCFLVRDSLNVRPPGRYVVSCLRVDKYEDLENGHKYKTDKQLRKIRQQQQRRQRRQNRHPVLHFVVNEIILQPGTVYERSQFTFGETLPSLTSAISAAVVNSNSKYQPGFDSVPDLIRYYVGGADDNAVLSYGGGNDGVVSGTMLSRTQQSEVRIRYPCNRRRPLMTNNFMTEAATPSILPSAMGNSRLNSRCALTATPNHTEELQILSTSPDGSTKASTSSQNKFYRRRSPSPPPHSSKLMRVQSSRSSVRKTPSSITTPEMKRSLESSNPRVDSQSSITSVSSNLSVSTLPRQPKSSFPLPSTSGSSPSSSKRPSSSVSKTNQLQRTSSCSGMPSRNTPDLTVSDLLAASSSPFINSLRPLPCTSKIDSRLPDSRNGICRISVSVSNDGVPSLSVVDPPRKSSSVRDTCNERDDDVFSLPFKREVTSSFSQVRIRNGGYRNMIPLWYKRQFINRPSMNSPDRHSSLNQLNNRQSQSRRRQAPSNNSSIKSSSENDEDVDDNDDDDDDNEQEQQQSSSSDSSFVSISTLKNEEIGRKRGKHRRLSNRKIVKKETEDDEDQDEEDQEVDNQTHNEEDREFENQTDNEEDQEVENQTDNEEEEEVENHTDNEKEDSEEDKVSSDEQTNLNSDFIVENSSSETSENENFQKCRTRWTNTMRKGLVDILEHPKLDHQNGQPTRITGTPNRDPRQRGSRQIKQAQNEDHEVKHMDTRTESTLLTSTDQAATLGQVSPPQSCVTHCSIRSSNNNLTENMIRQWLGLQRISNQSSNSDVAVLNNEGQIPQITILPRTRRQQWQSNSYENASEDHHLPAEEFLRENVSPSVETHLRVLKNMNHPQVDRMMLGFSIVNQEGGIAPVTKGCQLNMTNECSTGISSLEKGAACDYVNIDPDIDDHNNPVDEVDTQHGNINFLEKTHRRKKCQASKQQSNNNYNSLVGNNIEVAVDYENIISRSTDSTSDFNYENIDQTTDKKRQKIMNDFNGGSTAVANALLAVHLAIIGDPDDTGRTTVGTGKLAAALCRADGQTTVLPYRRNLTESEQAGPLLSTCPLQLLDQPGPAGRRARLDIIERFACLQYLVAMTVIVTPCLLLIGSHIKDKENLADVNFEWSLEDEYEYRRRRFYYRCAGFDSWRMSDNNSTSDDDDESYKLTANSDFDSGYSLPPREEWAVEKRHWLDLLTRHRAAVLDKWIRTAADAKQAVGDVYGYRALMSALCSDRIQSLQDAWAALRRLHTATAVAFESRLRPEFLGRREKNLVTVLGKPGTNDIDNNDVNELLQLPPNATVPDATALAVLYEHLYDNISDADSMNTTAASSNDIGSMKEKDPRLSSFFTSPLLLSPSPWLSLNSGISSGLGSSVGSDYGLSALHILCIQYSDWVQQSYGDDDSILPLIKSPMLQLDRFRSNFRALLRQYSGSDFYDNGDDNVKFNYVPSDKDVNLQRKENTFFHEEFNYNRNNEFAYERQYEDNVEKYGTSGDNYDCIDDDDDDDATVICCNDGNSLSTMRSDAIDTMHGDTHVSAKTENQQQTTTKNENIFPHEKDQEENLYDRWIEDASIYNRCSAPLNIVFCTELHVRLFWPPTLFLQDINDDKNTIDHKSAIPAYALGTTYVATATAVFDNEDKSTNHVLSPLELNHIITEQLDQAAKDMRLRYKAMDDFLDRACAYSTFVAKLAY